MDKRKKHFTKLRAEEVRRKPPTKAQKRNQMPTYLRNMAGYKDTQLKNKSFKEVQMLFDKEMKRVNSFVPIDSKIVPRDDEAVNVESLSTKYPIVDWKTHILIEDKMYYEIIRADRSTKFYKIFTAMGFNVYFEGGLRSDEHFNAQDYWLSISREDNLGLSRSHTSTIRNLILRVIHKMITYGLCQRITRYDKIQKNDLWLLSMFDARRQNKYANVAWVIAKWMKRKGVGTQKESQICCGQFISKLARKCRVLTEDVVRSLDAPIYCKDLDTITLRDLIDFEGKLILEDPEPGVPRVGIPRPPRASMQDLYNRIGRMEIRQDMIERMEYRQSYHLDRYHGVFEHMVGVYSVPLQGAYNPPGYAQPQYDQYYEKYQPPPPQYLQQQDDDE
ncbi:hypothetical protein Tco_0952270 [Tanacetum coccineum]|uniref:Uncharacterized protein n=1 Tax=Tanacetum coccineum TaxID=301880 RepID=A0ABQ5DWW6_9ASTR